MKWEDIEMGLSEYAASKESIVSSASSNSKSNIWNKIGIFGQKRHLQWRYLLLAASIALILSNAAVYSYFSRSTKKQLFTSQTTIDSLLKSNNMLKQNLKLSQQLLKVTQNIVPIRDTVVIKRIEYRNIADKLYRQNSNNSFFNKELYSERSIERNAKGSFQPDSVTNSEISDSLPKIQSMHKLIVNYRNGMDGDICIATWKVVYNISKTN
jgi:hypothetical protein